MNSLWYVPIGVLTGDFVFFLAHGNSILCGAILEASKILIKAIIVMVTI